MNLNPLKILYQKFCNENKIFTNPTMWNNQFIKNEVDLKNFRKDGAFIWQVRLGDGKKNYRKYYKYIKKRDRLNLLSKTFEDGLFGVNYFTIDKKKLVEIY